MIGRTVTLLVLLALFSSLVALNAKERNPRSGLSGFCATAFATLRAKLFPGKVQYLFGKRIESESEVDGVAVTKTEDSVSVGGHTEGVSRTDRGLEELKGQYDPRERVYPDELLDTKELEGTRVADICAGDGRFVRQLRRHNVDAIGIDTYLNEQQKNEPQIFKQALADKLPIPDESYDFVYSNWGALFHFPKHYRSFLGEMDRIVKVGGKIRLAPFQGIPLDELLLAFPNLNVTAQPEVRIKEGKPVSYWKGREWDGQNFIELTKVAPSIKGNTRGIPEYRSNNPTGVW